MGKIRAKALCLLMAGLLFLAGAARAETPAPGGGYASVAELNGKTVGVQTGTSFDKVTAEKLPEAQIAYFNTKADLVGALTSRKIEGFVMDEPVVRYLMQENSQVTYLPEYLETYEFAYAFPRSGAGEALRTQFNEFLAGLKERGALDALALKWFGEDEGAKTMPDPASLTAENGVLKMATEAGYAPFEYVRGSEVVGYDVEIAALFCQAYGYGLEVVDMNFDGILPAIQSGKCDFAGAGISITPERAESVLFSTTNFSGGTVMAVLRTGPDKSGPAVPEYRSFADLKGKTVSMITGAPFENLVRSKAPDVAGFTYFTNITDILLALKSGKTDAGLNNNALAQLAVNRDPEIALFPEPLQDGVFGFAFAKGDERRKDWQAAFDRIPRETIRAVWQKWTGSDEAAKTLPAQDWPGLNGTVRAAVCDTVEPMSYAGAGGELKGFDIELILRMARELDVRVEFVGMEFAAVLSYVQSGKALLGAGSIIATEERREAVDFLDYYPASFVLLVRAEKDGEAAVSFWDSVRQSFEKTFLRENRWQLFAQGVGTTLLITLLSILFGTALGFGVFMLCRKGNAAANAVTRFSVWLVQGMPMIVLLMILYYIVFGSVAISGVLVAVIGFTLTFGASVLGLLRMGVSAVDRGQYEAAWALGHTERRTFFRIILPQAIPRVLPAYQSEIVGLIKATAIVGYVAVQDLTKMGDIVRSRTYEAFFPLIAITVIYFALEGLFSFAVGRVRVRIDPKRRGRGRILKGVKTDD